MKKAITAILALALLSAAAPAAEKELAGSYRSSVLDREFYIYNTSSDAFVWVAGGKSVDRVQLVIGRRSLEDFCFALRAAGGAYASYVQSGEGSLKSAGVDFPAVTVRWRDTRWNVVRNHFLYPYMTHTPDGTPVLLFAGKLRKGKAEKEYILVFSSLTEIEEFVSVLEKLEK